MATDTIRSLDGAVKASRLPQQKWHLNNKDIGHILFAKECHSERKRRISFTTRANGSKEKKPMSSHYCGVSVHFTFSEENAKKIQDVLQPALNAYPGIQSTLLVNVTPVWGDETLQLRIDCESPEDREAFKARHWNIPGITREVLNEAGFLENTQADYGPYWKRSSPPVEITDTDSDVGGTGFNEAFGGW